jgi:AcrR family transcriptional regulator
MARKPATNPRKSASQERSRLTVDALLEATARVLVKDGYDRASTNKIAAVAGVSIGSLYQYFPSKEALVAAVIDRHMHKSLQLVRAALVKVATQPIEVAARELVSVMIDAHRVNPKLHRVLVEQTPRTGQLENIEATEREAYAMIRAYLEAHRDELDVADPDLAAFVCVTAVEALTHAAIVRRPESLSGEKAEELIDDVTRLVVRYLKKSADAIEPPARARRRRKVGVKRDRRRGTS